MTKQELKSLRKLQIALLITPYVRLQLVYQSYRFVYINKYLNRSIPLRDFVSNDIDRDICEPYINIANKLDKTNFIIIYASICRTLYKRTR